MVGRAVKANGHRHLSLLQAKRERETNMGDERSINMGCRPSMVAPRSKVNIGQSPYKNMQVKQTYISKYPYRGIRAHTI